jgi:hypothetical protein
MLTPGGNHSRTGSVDVAPNPFYIQAPSPLADEQARVLKHGDTFAVVDHYGEVKPSGMGEEGLYYDGTRHLSCLLLLLERHRPLFLSSTVKEDNGHLTVDLTNSDLLDGDQVAVPRGTLHILRCKFLWGAACYERIRAEPPEVCFTAPLLPEFLGEVRISDLCVGAGSVDLRLRPEGDNVRLEVLRRDGDVEVRLAG